MQEKRNQRVHYPQGPLQRGMQPLRLSLLHLGKLEPSKVRLGFLKSRSAIYKIIARKACAPSGRAMFIIYDFMKAMSKSELALRAGVSVTTLMRWCEPYREELSRMGLTSRNKVLPPHIVKFIAEKFCIDV